MRIIIGILAVIIIIQAFITVSYTHLDVYKRQVIRIGNKILIRSEVLDQFLKKNEGHNLKNKYEVIAV